jgi:hypothetical protein
MYLIVSLVYSKLYQFHPVQTIYFLHRIHLRYLKLNRYQSIRPTLIQIREAFCLVLGVGS